MNVQITLNIKDANNEKLNTLYETLREFALTHNEHIRMESKHEDGSRHLFDPVAGWLNENYFSDTDVICQFCGSYQHEIVTNEDFGLVCIHCDNYLKESLRNGQKILRQG